MAELQEPLVRGRKYQILNDMAPSPEYGEEWSFFVQNLSNPTTVQFLASPINETGDADWFEIKPSKYHFEREGEIAHIQIWVKVPHDAEPGRYVFIVEAQLEPEGEGPVKIVVGAGFKISFTVSEKLTPLGRFMEFYERHTYGFIAFFILVLIAVVLTVMHVRRD